jgi:hypothetical protein
VGELTKLYWSVGGNLKLPHPIKMRKEDREIVPVKK